LAPFGIWPLIVRGGSLLAHRFASKGSFLGGYFFGKRGLGSWLLALDLSHFSGQNGPTGLAAATERLRQIKPPGGQVGDLISAPVPSAFLLLGVASSFFLMWPFSSAGQPSGMVRLMAFKDTPSLKRALVLVAFYYTLTYFSLMVIFICARAMFPTEYLQGIGSEGEPDSIMPVMVRKLASPILSGLLLAAPCAAIMSTVAAFLFLVSSTVVRDLFHHWRFGFSGGCISNFST
jgi:Na+/pantothenate symporter